MKIATMARGFLPAPHPADMTNAPSDIAVATAEGLRKAGHAVTFFGPIGTSLPKVPVRTANLSPLVRKLQDLNEILEIETKSSHNLLGLWDQYLAHEMFKRADRGEFDVLHFHHPEAALPFARLYPKVPVVYTLHDPVDPWFGKAMRLYESPNQFYVSISDNQRKTAPDLPYIATVYNGVNTDMFSYNEAPEDYLLFTGRIMADKGVREAIEVAQMTDSRLLIIGAVYPRQQHYFDTEVKPYLSDKIQYLGFMEREKVVKYYQNARALLFPIQWEEPFGMTMIEAMACGTPVIAFARGSVPEVLEHGTTGFITRKVDGMAAAVGRLGEISRQACRDYVTANFSNEVMVKNYAKVYARAYAKVRKASPLVSLPAAWVRPQAKTTGRIIQD
jgi:glycosyltransferase involved in cell wall biosynthesis